MKRIAVIDAQPGMVLAKTVHSRDGHRLLSPGVELTQNFIDKLGELGIPTLYISEPDPLADLDTQALYETVKELPDIISFKTRLEAEKAVYKIMRYAKQGQIFDLTDAKNVIDLMIEEAVANHNIIAKLADIRILNDYTFAHSVNVCALSIATGLIFGYSQAKLRELGIGALLHDIGKVTINEGILNKPGPLTSSEVEEIRKHPQNGYNILRLHPEISPLSANIARQHHERYNGEGYPHGNAGEDIHEYAQIVAIGDTYDAMTADRSYKNMVLPYEAIEVIVANSGYYYNPRVVKSFVENTSIFPIGSVVKLSDGSSALVVSINRAMPVRPRVRMLTDASGRELAENIEIDLMRNNTLFVNEVVQFRN